MNQTNHKPATALPFSLSVKSKAGNYSQPAKGAAPSISIESGVQFSARVLVRADGANAAEAEQIADYLVHAANAHPKLVEALRRFVDGINELNLRDGWTAEMDRAEALLRELGEVQS